jgi:DNA replication protein DnaC
MEKNNLKNRWENEFFFLDVLGLFPSKVQKSLKELSFPKDLENTKIEGTYIQGQNGTGKTTLAAFMLVANIKDEDDLENNFFISASELLFEFKNSYSKNSDVSEKEILDKYSNVPLLIIDDFGIEKITDWSYQMLYILINRRYENMLSTIYTSNLTLEELGEKLGDHRIPSRIQGSCKLMKIEGTDFRLKV